MEQSKLPDPERIVAAMLAGEPIPVAAEDSAFGVFMAAINQFGRAQLAIAERQGWEREHFTMERFDRSLVRDISAKNPLLDPVNDAKKIARLNGGKYERAAWLFASYLMCASMANRLAHLGRDLSEFPRPHKATTAQIGKLWPDIERAVEFAVNGRISSIQREERIYAFVYHGMSQLYASTLKQLSQKTISALVAAVDGTEQNTSRLHKRDGSAGRDANIAKGRATRQMVHAEISRYGVAGHPVETKEIQAIARKVGRTERHVRRLIATMPDIQADK
ncbi:hypothetical protein [Burkholderia gladioli]|uniref:hypothetical protein n=1 Tax=Burkholderia gladioli TaxID=28095 RepID=UPI00164138C4|nr:hypothetical protein [Burkholderia gladioli]